MIPKRKFNLLYVSVRLKLGIFVSICLIKNGPHLCFSVLYQLVCKKNLDIL